MKTIITSILLTLMLFALSGCNAKTPYTNRSQMILMSPKEEMALGESAYRESLSNSKVLSDTKDAKRVKTIGAKIAQVAGHDEYNWEFNLVEDEQANAFCLPGGKVVVYTGILKYAQNDDQLATVISHEIAHALARHGAERSTHAMLQQGLGVAGNILLGSSAPQYQGIFNATYAIGSNVGVMLPYSRMQESEADEIGIILMYKAGYNIEEAVTFWQNMGGGRESESDFLSTHPAPATRIDDIKKVISKIKS